MSNLGPSQGDTREAEADPLARIPLAAFVSRWRTITGEPPAIMLESRADMLTLLVQSVPVAPLVPVLIDGWGSTPLPLFRGITDPAPLRMRRIPHPG